MLLPCRLHSLLLLLPLLYTIINSIELSHHIRTYIITTIIYVYISITLNHQQPLHTQYIIMEKIKSRWRKNYLEGNHIISNNNNSNNIDNNNINSNNSSQHHNNSNSSSKNSTPPSYEPLNENLYLDKRKNEHSRSRKDARAMVCDCILTKEERARGIMGCLDDCLNRMLMIECGPKCTLGEHCLNKRFQKLQSAKVEVFKTRKKGWGLRALAELPTNSFIMEYVGEVVRSKEFRRRVKKYTKQKIKHHYFMALRSDEIIDATVKGNLTRFINHSCEPNCETQKWTVNGDLRIGFFTIRDLQPGEEITFDYQFQRYGRKAQKCYCEAPSCRGYIGANEQTFSLNGNSSPQISSENKSHKKSYKHGLLVDVSLEDKITALAEDAAQGLKTKDQVIALASLSIKAEELADRIKLLDIIKSTKSEISLRLFVDYHGLEILSLWMRDPQADCDFKATIIDILERLPIQNKTKVLESNVYRLIERWATEEPKSISTPNNEQPSNDPDYTPISPVKQTNQKKSQEEENEAPDESKTVELSTLEDPNSSLDSENQSQPKSPVKEVATPSLTTLPLQTSNSPNIKSLANKLLKKFQALSPGFKIPRLNRLQRMEIEKKMDEEVITDDISSEDKYNIEQKNPFARNYFKSTTAPTNGIAKTNSLPQKRRYDSLTTNNIDLTPFPKISKEEHRQQFEMHVRLKDYYDTIEKHYGAATVEQLQLSQQAYLNINGLQPHYPHLNHQALGYIGANHQHIVPPIPPILVPQLVQPVQPVQSVQPIQPVQPIQSVQPTHLPPQQPAQSTKLPTLIVLANHSIEPAHAIDDALAFSICDYDEYYSIRDKPLGVEDVLDDLYPYPGSYYTTPSGETWFATVTLDRKTQQPRTVILNLQIRSDEDQVPTTSPKLQSVTQSSLISAIDEHLAAVAPAASMNITTSIQTTTVSTTTATMVANQAQVNSFLNDSTNESPTTNSASDLPGKIKKKMFERGVSKFIKDALSGYYKPDCQLARITSKEDFVFLARKLTLAVLEKELNRRGGCERLECNKQVKRKVEEFVRIYMAKFGKLYTRQNKA